MTNTTTTPVTGRAIAEGLRDLAAMFEAGDLPERTYPDHALDVRIRVASLARLYEFAARLDVPVRTRTASGGEVYSHITVELGEGSEPGDVYDFVRAAVLVEIAHIEDVAR